MKVILTETPKKVTSKKDGAKYTILSGIGENGAALTIFLNEEQAKEFPVDEKKVLSADERKELFDTYVFLDIEFDNNGRFVSITA